MDESNRTALNDSADELQAKIRQLVSLTVLPTLLKIDSNLEENGDKTEKLKAVCNEVFLLHNLKSN